MSNKNIKTASATKVPALSSLPGNIDPALKTFLNGIVQALEIRLGRRGDSRDRAITLRELINSGLAKELATNPYDPNAVGFTIATGTDINLTTSVTTPTGLTAVGGFTLVLLQWDLHSHLDHSHTEIWRHTSDDRNNSIHIGDARFTRFFSDQSVIADTTYYYWIRHVNEQGVISEWNAESGVSATTQPDIDFMLTLLTGEIRSTQLYSTLATDVGRIPGWHQIIGAYDLSTSRTLSLIDSTMDGWHEIIGSYNNNRTLTQIDTGITDIIAVNDTQGTAITGLKNSVYVNGDSSQGLALATASALTTLTTAVTNNAGDISDNADDIAINTTATTEVAAVLWLNGDSSNPLLLATASALSTTNSNVTSLDGVVTANASDIDDLEVKVNTTDGGMATANALDALEVTVTGTGGHSTKITVLETKVNTTDGGMATANALDGLETIVSGSGATSHASKLTALETKVNTTDGGMATANAHDALFATVNTGTGSHAAKITTLETKVNTTDGGMATANALDTLNTTVTGSGATSHASKITTLETKVNTTDGGMATANAHNALFATVNTGNSSHAAKITTLETTVDAGDGYTVRSALWDQQIVKIGYSYQPNQSNRLFDNVGTITSQADVDAYNGPPNNYASNHDNYVVWQDSMPMAKASTQIEVADGTGAYHTLEEQATIVSGTDGLTSQYTVKIETLGSGASARKVVGGFGLSSEPVASSGSYNINFGVLADKFFIEAPAANQSTTNSTITPFSVITSPQTFGSTTLPSGVYMDAAYLKFGSITEAHIGTGVIDTAHCGTMNASIINAGEINATFINLDNATISEDNGAIIIKDLGVDTAQINNLAVETLKIKDDAVTVPYGISGTGGITIGYDTSEVITNWTAVDAGGISINYGTEAAGVPSNVSILLSQMLRITSGNSVNVLSLAFRVFDGTSWIGGTTADNGRVGQGNDGTFTMSTGFSFTPDPPSSGNCVVTIRLYAKKGWNYDTWQTGFGHITILGTKK